jgi:hypothetical protein
MFNTAAGVRNYNPRKHNVYARFTVDIQIHYGDIGEKL